MNPHVQNTFPDQPLASDSKAKEKGSQKFPSIESYLLWMTLSFIFLAAFWPAFTGENDFILRDVGRYYMNAYRQVQEEWNAGRIPLWTHYDNCGTPLMANPCTAVFYPPKLVFFLPCSFELNLKILIIFHYLLTFFTMRALGLELGFSQRSAFLTSAFFVFSTPVLYGYCNLPFLFGTAWLPLAVLFGWRLLHRPTFRSAWLLGLCLCLMVLAGDPQTAYQTGLILGVAMLCGVGIQQVPIHNVHETSSTWNQFFLVRIPAAKWLILSALLAGGVSALQLIPAVEFNKTSIRAASLTPDSIWGVPSFILREDRLKEGLNWYDTLIGNPAKPAKHYLQVYSYSYPPSRMVEWIIPGIFGESLQNQNRWFSCWELDDENVWFPTLRMGLFPFVLAIIAILNTHKTHPLFKVLNWLLWVSALSLLASFGRFGLYGCWMNSLAWFGVISPEEIPLTGGELGGVYWLMVTFLPGYGSFRFPAKWLVFTVFGLSLLAGLGLNLLEKQYCELKWTKRISFISCAISLILVLTLCVVNVSYQFNNPQSKIPQAEVLRIVTNWLLHWGLLIVVLLVITRKNLLVSNLPSSNLSLSKPLMLGVNFVPLVLLWGNTSIIELHPRKYWKQPSSIAELIHQHAEATGEKHFYPPRFFRPKHYIPNLNHRSSWSREKFQGTNPAQQQAIELAVERDVLASHMHQEAHFNSVLQFVTLDYDAYEAMFDVVPLPDGTGYFHPRRAFDLWGTAYFITHKSQFYGDLAKTNLGLTQSWTNGTQADFIPKGKSLKNLALPTSSLVERYPDLMVNVNDSALPVARIVHNYTTIPKIHPLDIAARNQLYFQMFLGVNGGMDHLNTAVVEMDQPEITEPVMTNFKISTAEKQQEHCRIIYHSPDRITLDVELKQPGLVILSELHFPGWTCKVMATDKPTPDIITNMPEQTKVTRELPIKKVNHLQRGILIEKPGRYQVELVYWPGSFQLGCWITFLTILFVLWWEYRFNWLIKVSKS